MLFLSRYNDLSQPDQPVPVVRIGYLPERNIQTGIGDIRVKIPRIRDRSQSGIQFSSTLIPKYIRRTKNIEELLPDVYLWVDGIYRQARLESKQCLFVIIGTDEFGNKELLSVTDGFWENKESWVEALLDLYIIRAISFQLENRY